MANHQIRAGTPPLTAHTRSWMVRTWPTVSWVPPADDDSYGWSQWKHGITRINGEFGGRQSGESIWIQEGPDGLAGAAWEWVEWGDDMVVLRDPMTLVSNIEITETQWALLPRILSLNVIARAVPWQAEALKALRAHPARERHARSRQPARLPMPTFVGAMA
ncbi:MAG: hypothetical protein QM750_19795 [Rubrivivax sp.]